MIITHVEADAHFERFGYGQVYSGGVQEPEHTRLGLPVGSYKLMQLEVRTLWHHVGGTISALEPLSYEPDERAALEFSQRSSPPPAIIVKPHATLPNSFEILDGVTRTRAAHLAGRATIEAFVFQPTKKGV